MASSFPPALSGAGSWGGGALLRGSGVADPSDLGWHEGPPEEVREASPRRPWDVGLVHSAEPKDLHHSLPEFRSSSGKVVIAGSLFVRKPGPASGARGCLAVCSTFCGLRCRHAPEAAPYHSGWPCRLRQRSLGRQKLEPTCAELLASCGMICWRRLLRISSGS